MLATIPTTVLADDAPGDWQWALTVYAWLPSLSGDTSFPSSSGGSGSSIDVSGGDIIDALNFTFMGMLDVLAGARLLDLSQTLKWQLDGDISSLPLPGRNGRSKVSDSLWDGVVGVKGRVTFGAERSWYAPYYFDIGTGDSDLTMLAMAGVGYAFDWGELTGVWRYLDYDLGSGSPIESLTLSGPAIGATFRF